MVDESTGLVEWDTPADFQAFLQSKGTGFIFKHSTRCPISRRAHGEVDAFLEQRPGVPVCRVLVVESRPTSLDIAERLNIAHASPQVILLREGAPFWDTSHGGITAAALKEAWQAAETD